MSQSQDVGGSDATLNTPAKTTKTFQSEPVGEQQDQQQKREEELSEIRRGSTIEMQEASTDSNKDLSSSERVDEDLKSPTLRDLNSSGRVGSANPHLDNSTGPNSRTFKQEASRNYGDEENLTSLARGGEIDSNSFLHENSSNNPQEFQKALPSLSSLQKPIHSSASTESTQPVIRSHLPPPPNFEFSTSSTLSAPPPSSSLHPLKSSNSSSQQSNTVLSSSTDNSSTQRNALTHSVQHHSQADGNPVTQQNTSTGENLSSYSLPSVSNVRSAASRRLSLSGMSRLRNGWKYRLVVVQHPERARMCGFGDKDRRPLSPSLIVKLIVTDDATGEEISPWEINSSLFFLAADLCHPDDLMLAPRNLLVHQHATAVPTSTLTSNTTGGRSGDVDGNTGDRTKPLDDHLSGIPSTGHGLRPPPLGGSDTTFSPGGDIVSNNTPSGYSQSHSFTQFSTQQVSSGGLTTVTMEHYTRNLVGAAVTSANVLRDEDDRYCIFFVLQDLSVRTEGAYRIRLVFTDLAQQDGDTTEGVSDALAEAYTDPFTVYSPRRFPGMLEPTELSKKLAAQGVKIAVRSDKKKRQRGAEAGMGPSWSQAVSGMVGAGNPGSGGGGSAEGGEGEIDDLEDEEE